MKSKHIIHTTAKPMLCYKILLTFIVSVPAVTTTEGRYQAHGYKQNNANQTNQCEK